MCLRRGPPQCCADVQPLLGQLAKAEAPDPSDLSQRTLGSASTIDLATGQQVRPAALIGGQCPNAAIFSIRSVPYAEGDPVAIETNHVSHFRGTDEPSAPAPSAQGTRRHGRAARNHRGGGPTMSDEHDAHHFDDTAVAWYPRQNRSVTRRGAVTALPDRPDLQTGNGQPRPPGVDHRRPFASAHPCPGCGNGKHDPCTGMVSQLTGVGRTRAGAHQTSSSGYLQTRARRSARCGDGRRTALNDGHVVPFTEPTSRPDEPSAQVCQRSAEFPTNTRRRV